MFYELSKLIYGSEIFKTIGSFVDNICNLKSELQEAKLILSFNNKTRLRSDEDKNLKNDVDSANNLYHGRELVNNAFKSGLFPSKSIKRTGLKILIPKQTFQKLPIAFAQVKTANNLDIL